MTTPRTTKDLRFGARVRGLELEFLTTWGLFSPREIDEGSRLLIESLELKPDQRTLDLGCGYGAIGVAVGKETPEGEVHLVDKDFVAVEYARRNLELNGLGHGRAYLSNGLAAVPPDVRFDCVVANLPGQVGNEMLSILLEDSHDRLVAGGHLWIVTVAGLRKWAQRRLTEVFGNYTKVKQRGTHTVSVASKEQVRAEGG